jgi:hypothetical protein
MIISPPVVKIGRNEVFLHDILKTESNHEKLIAKGDYFEDLSIKTLLQN